MIAAAIFSVGGIIAWQNIPSNVPDEDAALFGVFAIVCWVVAGLCASGVINTY